MSHVARGLHQDITLWAPAGSNNYGVAVFAAPVLMKGRWEDMVEMYRDPQGQEFYSKCVVYVDRHVPVGSYIALGNYSAQANPLAVVPAHEVRTTLEFPSIRNANTERRAIL